MKLRETMISRKLNGSGEKEITCYGQGCDKVLEKGDVVYSHTKNKGARSRETHVDYWCIECYEKLWI